MDPTSPKFTARNQAVHDIACKLNMGNLVPSCEFGIHKRQLGVLMSVAPGMVGNDVEFLGLQGFKRYFSEYSDNFPFCALVMRNLNRLECLDALCAHPDRFNGGNVMFDVNGTATGIDNDICLYPFPGIIGPCSASDSRQKLYRKGCTVGFPLVIDAATLRAFERLDIKLLRYELRNKLTLKELDALEVRYNMLLEHYKALENHGFAISNWETWQHPQTGDNVYQYYLNAQIKRVTGDEEEPRRNSLAQPYERAAAEILRLAGGREENLRDDQRMQRQMYLESGHNHEVGFGKQLHQHVLWCKADGEIILWE